MNLALTPDQYAKLTQRAERVNVARLLMADHDALESRKTRVKECEKVLEEGRIRRERDHRAQSENELLLRRKAGLDPTDENKNDAKRASEELAAANDRRRLEHSKEDGTRSNAQYALNAAERAKDRLRSLSRQDHEIFELKDGIYRLTAAAEAAFPPAAPKSSAA
jgi:hypothetical protein